MKNQTFGKASLINEITILRLVNHPSIIDFEEVSETKNSIYIIMEYLEGNKIIDLACFEVFPIKQRRQLIKQLLTSLSYLQSKKIIHRDIKPENIIFKLGPSVNNTIKLIDFGLATYYQQSSYIFKKCGTVGFIAPEIFKQDETSKDLCYNYKSDIFSLGIVFFCMIFGRHPFDGNTINQVLIKNKNYEIKWKSILERGKYNEEEINIVQNMLQLNPVDRKSADDFLSDIYFKTATN